MNSTPSIASPWLDVSKQPLTYQSTGDMRFARIHGILFSISQALFAKGLTPIDPLNLGMIPLIGVDQAYDSKDHNESVLVVLGISPRGPLPSGADWRTSAGILHHFKADDGIGIAVLVTMKSDESTRKIIEHIEAAVKDSLNTEASLRDPFWRRFLEWAGVPSAHAEPCESSKGSKPEARNIEGLLSALRALEGTPLTLDEGWGCLRGALEGVKDGTVGTIVDIFKLLQSGAQERFGKYKDSAKLTAQEVQALIKSPSVSNFLRAAAGVGATLQNQGVRPEVEMKSAFDKFNNFRKFVAELPGKIQSGFSGFVHLPPEIQYKIICQFKASLAAPTLLAIASEGAGAALLADQIAIWCAKLGKVGELLLMAGEGVKDAHLLMTRVNDQILDRFLLWSDRQLKTFSSFYKKNMFRTLERLTACGI